MDYFFHSSGLILQHYVNIMLIEIAERKTVQQDEPFTVTLSSQQEAVVQISFRVKCEEFKSVLNHGFDLLRRR